MRLALAGKGGAGKTTISATAARLLARSGRRVVAVDADSNPNLHAALGMDAGAAAALGALPTSLVSRRFDGPALAVPLEDVLERYASAAPDGVQVVPMGAPAHADEGCLCGAHAVVSVLLSDLGTRPEVVTIIDLEASPEHLSRGTARHADVLMLVAEPYYRSLEAVRLQASLAEETAVGRTVVVANKCRNQTDTAAIEEFCTRHRLELAGTVPWSEAALAADAGGAALLDHAPADPAVAAIGELAQRLSGATVGAGV